MSTRFYNNETQLQSVSWGSEGEWLIESTNCKYLKMVQISGHMSNLPAVEWKDEDGKIHVRPFGPDMEVTFYE